MKLQSKKDVTHLSVWTKGGIDIEWYGTVLEDHRSCEKKYFFLKKQRNKVITATGVRL